MKILYYKNCQESEKPEKESDLSYQKALIYYMGDSKRKKDLLQVHIVEQHNDAVSPIHRAIASRLLPFSCAAMVHLDSHPDLLIPVHMQAETVFKPAELYESLSIENWILPLVYAKHFDHIVWVKPPWARQIPVSKQRFLVGQCVESGCVRVTSKENYFLTDGLFRPGSELSEPGVLTLQVEEVLPAAWADLDPTYASSESVPKATELTQGEKLSWVKSIQDSLKDKPYVLDIDLDFFSTANPFRHFIEPTAEQALKRLYHYTTPSDFSDESIASFTKTREEQLNLLEEIFTELEDVRLKIESDESKANDDLSNTQPFAAVLDNARKQGLAEEKIQDLEVLCQTLLQHNLRIGQDSSSSKTSFSSIHHSVLSEPAVHTQSSNPLASCTPKTSTCTSPSKPDDLSQTDSINSDISIRVTDNASNVGEKESQSHMKPCESLLSENSEKISPQCEPKQLSACEKPLENVLSMQKEPCDKQTKTTLKCEQTLEILHSTMPESFDRQGKETLTLDNEPSKDGFLGGQISQRESLTFLQLHDFGCTLDDTELPHHLSSQPQVAALMSEIKVMLESLPRPALVTIARSSDDGYCPKGDVDLYQRDVLKMLEEIFGSLTVTEHYES